MCFSASASFGASAVLAAIGTAAIIRSRSVPQALFASIPLIFSVQQLAEGMLWLSLEDTFYSGLQSFYLYTFLVFAIMVWPFWIPFTLRLLEKEARRKKIMSIFLWAGLVVFVGVCIILLLFPVTVGPDLHHLHYEFGFTRSTKKLLIPFNVLYFLATILPAFISSHKRMKWLGFIFLASYFVAVSFFSGFVISVWCFFAAIMSIIILWILNGIRREIS